VYDNGQPRVKYPADKGGKFVFKIKITDKGLNELTPSQAFTLIIDCDNFEATYDTEFTMPVTSV